MFVCCVIQKVSLLSFYLIHVNSVRREMARVM